MEIIKHIEYLLHDNDCVIVPGFGAFICHDVMSERLDKLLLPPSRRVSFNGAVNQNDGLLIDFIARSEGCSYALAANKVDNEVEIMKECLQKGECVEFGNIGQFQFAETGCLIFTPCPFSLVGNSSNFGLPTVDMQRFRKEKKDTSRLRKEGRFIEIGRTAMRIAASVAVIAVLALTLTTPISMDYNTLDKAGIANVSIKKDATIVNKPCVPSENADIIPEKQTEEESIGKKEKMYSIIIASLTSYEQAQKYVAESKEQNLEILAASPGSHVYKVALASGVSRAEMEKYIREQKIKEKYPDVWICRN